MRVAVVWYTVGDKVFRVVLEDARFDCMEICVVSRCVGFLIVRWQVSEIQCGSEERKWSYLVLFQRL